jgi:FKBP12-rapamycin complex-associated protein
MMLWFDHGDRAEVFKNLRDNLKAVPVDTWLEVVPQLMARLDSQQNVGLLVKQVVIDVSKVHPQVSIYFIIFNNY